MLRVFPVNLAARVSFEDTWGAPRGNHTHEGTDVFAPMGTEVYAVDEGRVEFHPLEGIGGNVAYLHSTDRTRYVYSHLQGFAGETRKVKAGELIGYVGNTGNAAGLPPHVHFEIHPLEAGPIDPYPALKAARDAQLHPSPATPPATPAPGPTPPTTPVVTPPSSPVMAMADAGDVALALLLFWGWKQLSRGRRTMH